MRFYSLILSILLASSALAQSSETPRSGRKKTVVYSASSDWQKVVLKPTPRIIPPASVASQPAPPATTPVPTNRADAQVQTVAVSPPVRNEPVAPTRPAQPTGSSYRPAFTGDFATNRNGWKAGAKGDYHFQIGLGRYNIRKRNENTKQVAFSYVPLPADINLNVADIFTIKVDMLADSGRIPSGGLLFGVRDSLNFNAFTMNAKGAISIIRVANGETFSDYMPGDFFSPGVPVDKNRNRLTIRRKGDALHFYVNEQEVRSSPYPFKMLAGNSVGMITSSSWISFQKLNVTLGGSTADFPVTRPPSVSDRTDASASATPSATENASAAVPASTSTTALTAPRKTRPAVATFNESFAENQNEWLTGKKDGYEFELMTGGYYIRKTALGTSQLANSSVKLPPSVNLNKAESFTISAEMVVPPGIQPDGGLTIGVKDADNLCQFRIIGRTKVSIKSLRKGISFADYMPGKITQAKVAIDRDRNTLMIQKKQNKLHFYINGEEVDGSPQAFKPFPGNGVGFVSAATTVKFQKLVVQVDPGMDN